MENKVLKFMRKISSIEPNTNITQRLVAIEYSKKYGHEICVLQLLGKNAFPKMSTSEILSDKEAMSGLSQDDLIKIVRLDDMIHSRKERHVILERDEENGEIVLMNSKGIPSRYSEISLSGNRELLNTLSGSDGYSIGYRAGFKAGFLAAQEKAVLFKTTLKNKILTLVSGGKDKKNG